MGGENRNKQRSRFLPNRRGAWSGSGVILTISEQSNDYLEIVNDYLKIVNEKSRGGPECQFTYKTITNQCNFYQKHMFLAKNALACVCFIKFNDVLIKIF